MNSNGTGSIQLLYKKKDGKQIKTYQVRYRVFDPVKGKKVQKTKSGFSTKGEAQEFLNDITNAIKENRHVSKTKITVAQVLNEWYSVKIESVCRKNTKLWYDNYIRIHIVPSIGAMPVQSLTPKIIQDFYNSKAETMAATSVAHIHRTLKMGLDYAVNILRCIPANPARSPGITLRKSTEYTYNVLDQKTIIQLVLAYRDDGRGLIIALAGLMGLRRGEIRGLKWEDIDFKSKTLHLSAQLHQSSDFLREREPLKTPKSIRTLPLSELVIELLDDQEKRQNAEKEKNASDYLDLGYVCTGANSLGKPYALTYINGMMSTITKQTGLPHMRFHDLRHSYATNLIYSGIPIPTVSKLLGHASPKITTETYTHVLESYYNKNQAAINEKISADLKEVLQENSENSGNMVKKRSRRI